MSSGFRGAHAAATTVTSATAASTRRGRLSVAFGGKSTHATPVLRGGLMANLDAALADTRAAADELMATAERAGAAWATPRAPGKWSPSQLVEHVSRALEESAHVVTEHPSKFPSLPSFVRPLLRGLLFKRVLNTGKF